MFWLLLGVSEVVILGHFGPFWEVVQRVHRGSNRGYLGLYIGVYRVVSRGRGTGCTSTHITPLCDDHPYLGRYKGCFGPFWGVAIVCHGRPKYTPKLPYFGYFWVQASNRQIPVFGVWILTIAWMCICVSNVHI